MFLVGVDHLLHFGGDAAQVAALGGGVKIDGRLDIVVGDHRVAEAAADIDQAAQNLGRCACAAGHRQILEGGQGVQPVFRRLRRHVVGHAVLGIEPEIRRGLGGAGQRGGQRVGDVALGQPHLRHAAAVGIHLKLGHVAGLLHARVHQAGNFADLAQDAEGERLGLPAAWCRSPARPAARARRNSKSGW